MTVILAIILVGLAIGGLAVRMIIKKNGEFPGTCSSNNPLDDNGHCTVCGARSDQNCKR